MDQQTASASLRVLDGHTYADWESVYDGNVVGFYRLLYRKVGNRPDAEDLVSEMFAAALPHIRLPATVGEVRACPREPQASLTTAAAHDRGAATGGNRRGPRRLTRSQCAAGASPPEWLSPRVDARVPRPHNARHGP